MADFQTDMKHNATKVLEADRKRQKAVGRELEVARRSRLLDVSESMRLEKLRLTGTKARSNVGGAPFNIINFEYDRSHDGERLRKLDELMGFRRKLRAAFIAKVNHIGFDPITGCINTTVAI